MLNLAIPRRETIGFSPQIFEIQLDSGEIGPVVAALSAWLGRRAMDAEQEIKDRVALIHDTLGLCAGFVGTLILRDSTNPNTLDRVSAVVHDERVLGRDGQKLQYMLRGDLVEHHPERDDGVLLIDVGQEHDLV